jgi:hypothetical protein
VSSLYRFFVLLLSAALATAFGGFASDLLAGLPLSSAAAAIIASPPLRWPTAISLSAVIFFLAGFMAPALIESARLAKLGRALRRLAARQSAGNAASPAEFGVLFR